MEILTHWKKLTDPNFIGAYSLQPGEEKTVEIVSVGRQRVKGADGKETDCTVAVLKNEKPFILNKTNCKTLTKVFGTPFIEKWQGKKMVVYAENVKAFGEIVEALRIRPIVPILPVLNPKSAKWPGAIDALKNNKTTIEAIQKSYQLSDKDKQLLVNLIMETA